MSDYADYTIIQDGLAGREHTSGTNAIVVEGRGGRYSITYEFGKSGYLIWGSGNLVGKTVNIRFDGGRPGSLQRSGGSGYCSVISSSKL